MLFVWEKQLASKSGDYYNPFKIWMIEMITQNILSIPVKYVEMFFQFISQGPRKNAGVADYFHGKVFNR
jgi:hypothetical protein